ncbi:HU family DNA-binding protein [Muricoccus radiodurans]|uniref:HU family DNA-binding protein n=1 Tax=Muricoccus radiodurans TaxID=2231721 RepID=UPI003CF3FC46
MAKAATKAPAGKAPAKAAAAKAPPKAAAAKGGAAAAAAVSLKQIAAQIAESHEVPKRQAEAMLGDFIQSIGDHLRSGTKVRIVGLGIMQVRARPARTGRNPATGATIEIAASKKIAFRPAKELKDSI